MSEEYIVINGGKRLCGEVDIYGAKNAVLPMLAAGVLTPDEVVIENCPYITDVDFMVRLLGDLGLRVVRDGRRISVCGSVAHTRASEDAKSATENPYKAMRSSMFMLGALLSATGSVEMPMPGGCDIGARPLDIHLDGLRKMGAHTECDGGFLRCSAGRLHGADIVMRYPSVGATENLLMCASLADGYTRLVNCAREPEIVALARLLRAMGARISGEGTSIICIEGVDKLSGTIVRADGDRIVAGTVLSAVALCGGYVMLRGASDKDMQAVCRAFSSE
ncbi:MAG: UDP-N-acetylglucosamine 1-carboxyvinyltransferase, partial [Clostridia bacterium]|nr:UDP-N-acetylglucosamine 1-carboxyvinyltransferase [Clostridia bacterium]